MDDLARVAFVAAITLLCSTSALSQKSAHVVPTELSPGLKAARVRITQGPELEAANSHQAIIRWTSNNPAGTEGHFGVVTYGTDPNNLNKVAKSHIRLNRSHSDTEFRVLIEGLQPTTTYYYRVESVRADGASDGIKSPVKQFSTE